MRYVRDDDYDEHSAGYVETAEALFDRYVGHVLAEQTYEDDIRIVRNTGRLTRADVTSIMAIRATGSDRTTVPWDVVADIDPSKVDVWEGRMLLPSTFFGTSYTSAHITYRAGLADIPDDIRMTVLEIAYRIATGEMDDFSGVGALSDKAQAVIEKYRDKRY